MQDCRLAAHDLACRRGDRLLFKGLSLSLVTGQALQIVGANGVGKSSLIRILAGLLQPYAGEVARFGGIGLVDDRTALDPQLPLGRALAFWRAIDGDADNAAGLLGLAHLLDVPVRFLSTGQRKRAALARLVGQGAEIWLLDEPLNGLDTHAARLAEDMVADHCSAGGICVIASHQPFNLPALTRIDLEEFTA